MGGSDPGQRLECAGCYGTFQEVPEYHPSPSGFLCAECQRGWARELEIQEAMDRRGRWVYLPNRPGGVGKFEMGSDGFYEHSRSRGYVRGQ